MEEIIHDKGISTKTDKKKEELGLLYSRQQSWNPKQAIILKHIITYINPKGMIGMLVTGRRVWGHAYRHKSCRDV